MEKQEDLTYKQRRDGSYPAQLFTPSVCIFFYIQYVQIMFKHNKSNFHLAGMVAKLE